MLGIYLYDRHNIKKELVLFVIFFIFVAKWLIWKFRNDIKYKNNFFFDTIKIKKMLKLELKSNTALITKSPLLSKKYGNIII